MERGKSQEIDLLISDIEQTTLRHLEQPDHIYSNVSYGFELNDGYYVSLENRTITDTAEPCNSDHETLAFVNYLAETSDETTCGHRLGFSVVFSHILKSLSGFQFVPPVDMPQTTLSQNPGESIFLGQLVELAKQVYDREHFAFDQPNLEDYYYIGESQLTGDLGASLKLLIEASNKLLAVGPYHERRTMSVGSTEERVSLESNMLFGPTGRLSAYIVNQPVMTARISVEGLDYSLEQHSDGTFELKTLVSDLGERYRNYRSFTPDYGPDGKVIGFGINYREILEKEAEDREMGLFVPSAEKLHLIMERLQNAA